MYRYPCLWWLSRPAPPHPFFLFLSPFFVAAPTAQWGSGSCAICPGGSMCPIGTSNPIPCGLGFYSDELEGSCHECLAGYYCPWETTSRYHLDTIFRCPPGLYCPAGMDVAPTTQANSCSKGRYCPEATPVEVPCPVGSFNNNTGVSSSACTPCTAGFFCTEGVTVPNGPCGKGHFCLLGSSSSTQEPCPAGTYLDEVGGSSVDSCKNCTAGGYCPRGSVEPEGCPAGHYCPPMQGVPIPCPIGTYSNKTNLTSSVAPALSALLSLFFSPFFLPS